MEHDDRSRPRMGCPPLAFWLRKAGARRSARTGPSRHRLQPGGSTCAASGIALTPTRMSILAEESQTPKELDSPLDGFGWEDMWDNFDGPQAKAFHLLKKLDLGSPESKLRRAGEIIFEESGGRSRQLLHLGGAEGRFDGVVAAGSPYRAWLADNVKVGGLLGDSA
jgi:hypothetical protein